MLSTLLGTHPPKLPVRSLVKVGELFDIPEGTVRVALSRMLADGEITADNGTYHLSGRLLERATRQDESRAPRTRRWSGRWTAAIVTATGRPAAERTALRRAMTSLRMAERREGVWLRPANLIGPDPLPADVEGRCLWFEGRPDEDPVQLARALWDLDAWATRAHQLHDALADADELADGFVVSAAVLRHLLADPLLPPRLLPDDWPGDILRDRYDTFDTAYRRQLGAFVHT
jgi:phenylacetic acid degradation operon negative regulatory protein